MQHLDAFIVADDNISFSGEGGAFGAAPDTAAPTQASAAAVLLDLETTGTFIACAASAVNFVADHPHLASAIFAALPQWLPAAPASVRGTRLELLRNDLPVAVCGGLRDLGLHLRIAVKATRRHCDRLASGAPVAADALDELVSLWGLLCERTMTLVEMLKPLAPPAGSGREMPGEAETSSAERLLAAAALGHWPCIGERGAITIPGWIERRSKRRHNIRIECRIIEAGREWTAQTVDLSLTGVGLMAAPPLAIGTRAVLVIGPLAELRGEVVWSKGDRLGFRFDHPLASLADLGRSLMSE